MNAASAAAVSASDLLGLDLVVSLPGILLVAFVAARLLGVRRSPVVTLLAGLVGWLAGVALSSLIASGQANPRAGFARNVWVFSTVFTMSATVWFELLARPGTLARAQAGVAHLPRPIRALRRRARRVSRYAQITRIAVRHGLAPYLGLGPRGGDGDTGSAPPQRRTPTAARLRRALEECGGIFVKLGQVLATRTDLVPAHVAAELARLQDDVAPADPAAVRTLLEAEVGRPLGEVFAEFGDSPIAAASIAQAYRARLRDGTPVVVKVQRPGIEAAVRRDIEVLDELARLVETRTSWGRDYHVRELSAEFIDRLREELDFRVEGRTATEIRANLQGHGLVRVPQVYAELTTARVIVMEWLDGRSVRDSSDVAPERRRELADALLRSLLQQVLVDGRFHADPHPGNVLLLADGSLGLLDFGAAGRLDPVLQATLRDVLVGVAQRDAAVLRDALLAVAEPRADLDENALERALARFVARHLGPGATPSAAMLTELLQLCFDFGLSLPPEFVTVFRALGTIEGTLQVLSPGYLAIDAAQRIAAEWAQDRLGSLDEVARAEVTRLLPVLRRLPSHVDRIAALTERGRLQARLSIGLFCATVLILRVLVAVLQDGPS